MTKTNKKAAARAAVRPPRKRQPAASRNPDNEATAPAAAPSIASLEISSAPGRQTKKGAILSLLQRPDGAAISELTAATGWQVHSVRAALTGLRKEGKELLRDKDQAGITLYRIAEER
jgi:hypothetical protein